jgi:hypothetical protein
MNNQELSSSDERILKTFLVSDLTGEILGKKRKKRFWRNFLGFEH